MRVLTPPPVSAPTDTPPTLGRRFCHWWWCRLRVYALPWLVVAVLGTWAIHTILTRAGEAALPLDDSYIHLQYARQLSRGAPFEFTPGAGYSSGATSWLWSAAFAPFFWLGLNGVQLVWVGWLFGGLLHAGAMVEAARLARRLAGSTAAFGAGALVAAFGAFSWFAYSGMETVALAWLLLRGARVGAALVEDPVKVRPGGWQLAALGALAPLLRPEGALLSLAAAALGGWRWWRERGPRGRGLALVMLPLLAPAIIPTTHWLMTGRASSSTALVKWALLDPYLDRDGVINLTVANIHLLWSDLLNGGGWTRMFVPPWFVWLLLVGCVAVVAAGIRRRRMVTSALVVLGVMATMVPCTYSTLLWNRVRYIWPFAGFWLVAVALGAAALGDVLARIRPILRIVEPTLVGGLFAWLLSMLPWTMSDLAQSARAIHLQQVKLGRWAHNNLPDNAIIGVNDTGAIAYFSQRRTFDVVGLTTQREARYWAAGAGSRFEHYERLPPAVLPTHFIVYPGWMAMPAVLGPVLYSATVREQSILGGATMVAYKANYSLLHSGDAPFANLAAGPMLDALDVADLESEQQHHYQLLDGSARRDQVRMGSSHDGRLLVDGGRLARRQDRFVVGPLGPSVMILRVTSDALLQVRVGQGPALTARPLAQGNPWHEQRVSLPALSAPTPVVVRARDGRRFDAYHYFWLLRRAGP